MSKESANHSELPRMIKPMLAQARSEPFNCDKHLFEVKWDGTRCLGFIEDDRLRLQNRHLMNTVDRYPELACLRGLPAGTVIDGEIVVLRDGRPSFQKLQQRDHLQDPTRIEILSKRMPVRLMAFDLLYVRGRRITSQPLFERRQRPYQKAAAGFPGGIGQSAKAARACGLSFRVYMPIARLAVQSSLLRADGNGPSAIADLRGFDLNDRNGGS